MEHEKLEPAVQLLILSFSVAAAQEIKVRLQQAVEKQNFDDELLYVNIRTFDSFASGFMYSWDPDIKLEDKNYESRIKMATELINNVEGAGARLKSYRHIMIDEIQDLVGPRALFSLSIIKTAECGFTLFGDPAQSIYNFLRKDDQEGLTSDEFILNVKKAYPKTNEINLLKNYRVGDNIELRSIAEGGRQKLLACTPNESYFYLKNIFSDLKDFGKIYDITLPSDLHTSKTAVLCRTNGQALLAAGQFFKKNGRFFIKRSEEEACIQPWIGRLLFNWHSQVIKKQEFIKSLSELGHSFFIQADSIWSDLIRLTKTNGNDVSAVTLRRILLEGDCFAIDEFSPGPDEVIISSIHRSKGREFDNVVLVVKEDIREEDFLDEGRVLFVGLTRAQKQLFKLSERGGAGLKKVRERWIRTMPNRQGNLLLTAIELGVSGDIDIHSPVCLKFFDYDLDEIKQGQTDIWSKVRRGSAVRLKYWECQNGIPVYSVEVEIDHNFIALSWTTIHFGSEIRKILQEITQRGVIKKFPTEITDVWVKDIVTEVGNLGHEDIPRSILISGVWLGIRIQGLGNCREWREMN